VAKEMLYPKKKKKEKKEDTLDSGLKSDQDSKEEK
jgi:hypothetical protein